MKRLFIILMVIVFSFCILPISAVYAAAQGKVMPVNLAPKAPSDFCVSSATLNEINLSWTDNSSNESGFILEKRKAYTTESWSRVANLRDNITTYTDDNIEIRKEYEYRICANNRYGKSSYITTLYVKPAAPSELIAVSVGSTEVTLRWNDNSDNEDKFNILCEYDGAHENVWYTVEADCTEYTVRDLVPDCNHCFVVYALNEKLYRNSNIVRLRTKPLELPAIPSDLNVIDVGSAQVTLRWTDNSDNEMGFKVFRNNTEGAGDGFFEVGANCTEFTDTRLIPETIYQYNVFAYNEAGETAFSNIVEVTTKPIEEEASIVEVEEVPPVEPTSPTTGRGDRTVITLTIDNQDSIVDGTTTRMDVAPIIQESRTFLPIKYVVEPLGATVCWDGVERKVRIELDDKIIELWIDNNTALVSGRYVLIDSTNPNVKPFIQPPGRTMLPIRFVSEQLGCEVGWNGEDRVITISK